MDFATYTQWSGYGTLFAVVLTVLAFAFKWGFRFRLVGISGFMLVLTTGLFGLSLGLFERAEIPGSVKFNRVYDNGANQIVITVEPTVTPTEVEATLLQAANTYFSFGRGGNNGDNQMKIRARTLIHPEPGQSKPLYLGELRRPLGVKSDEQIKVELSKKAFAQLPQS